MRGGIFRCLFQPQAVADRAALALLGLLLQPFDGGVELVRLVGQLDDRVMIACLLDKALQLGFAAVILGGRVDVGVII